MENSSCAHLTTNGTSNLISTISAPSDQRINIGTLGRCDTNITLPVANFNIMPGCTPAEFTTQIDQIRLNTNGGNITLHSGIYNVIYCLEDNCRSIACDTMRLVILDSQVPQMTCKPDAVISLNSEGEGLIPAEELNGGSFDNCGHVFFKVKRMLLPNGYSCTSIDNPNYKFDDEVKFCCNDIINSPIQVIIRIYDIFPGDGVVEDTLLSPHFVDCMVMVTVIDKLPPTVICPPGTTINCGADIDNTLASLQPTYEDNCSRVIVDSQIIRRINSCGYGTLDRNYTFTDVYGSSTICNQTITILKNTNFNGLDAHQLQWPAHKTIYACRINADTIDAGRPIIVEDECDNVLVRSSDNLYYFNRGGVCGKLLRLWEVINYCIYDRYYKPNPNVPENGYYSYYQEIKIIDTIPPTILNARDTLLKSLAADCGFSQFTLPNVSSSDCGVLNNLTFSYEVDYNSDGSINRSGNGPNASGLFPMGEHTVTYFVKDSCNNIASKSEKIKVKDGKPPSAIVLYGLGTSLNQMSTGIMAMINARQFNNKSDDNCTASDNLRFSFSININDTIRTYNCKNQGVQNVVIYVWDECLNYSTVNSFLTVFDVNNICPTSIQNVILSGTVASTQAQSLSNVEVFMSDSIHYESKMSSLTGEYAFKNIPVGMSLHLILSCKENPTDGVSTADIVKIQQHILGKKRIENPYELIAADVDMNGRITSADISHIRKLVLGINSQWPNQQSFVFIDKLYEFKNKLEPWQECSEQSIVRINNVKESSVLDFVGIKLGDVNSSLQIRSINKEIFNYNIEENRILISSNSKRLGYGMQIEIDLSKSKVQIDDVTHIASDFFEVHYHINKSKLVVSLISNELVEVTELATLLSIHFAQHIDLIQLNKNSFTNSEWIDRNLNISIVEFQNLNELVNQDFVIESFGPNPVTEDFSIKFLVKENSKLLVEIISQDGRIVEKKRLKITSENHTVNLHRSEFESSGIYTLRISNAKMNWTQKLFIK